MKAQMQKGFTLIELMIVVAIIGILAAIALPAYQDYTKRSHVSEGLSLASGAKTAITEYYSDKGTWPADNTAAGIALAASIQGNAVRSVTVATSTIEVLFNTKVEAGKKLVLKADANGGSVEWDCTPDSGTDVNPKFLPSTCRN
tara:strand:- start:12281 stop:12712 length:432 start_codon:yes stop_codon:yes gene_type:complete